MFSKRLKSYIVAAVPHRGLPPLLRYVLALLLATSPAAAQQYYAPVSPIPLPAEPTLEEVLPDLDNQEINPPAPGEEQVPVIPPRMSSLYFEIDISERRLRVFRDGYLLQTHPVSVGGLDPKTGRVYPSPVGTWQFIRIDLNPDWTPPENDWTRGKKHTPPGHKDNPMGRARLIFNPPYSIHGTKSYRSLGKAQSHGSIRIANEVSIELARLLLQEAELYEGDEWFERIIANPRRMRAFPVDGVIIPITLKP